jgi:hypothetical protein
MPAPGRGYRRLKPRDIKDVKWGDRRRGRTTSWAQKSRAVKPGKRLLSVTPREGSNPAVLKRHQGQSPDSAVADSRGGCPNFQSSRTDFQLRLQGEAPNSSKSRQSVVGRAARNPGKLALLPEPLAPVRKNIFAAVIANSSAPSVISLTSIARFMSPASGSMLSKKGLSYLLPPSPGCDLVRPSLRRAGRLDRRRTGIHDAYRDGQEDHAAVY